MTSFLKSAKSVYDVDSELQYVEIVYEKYVPGKGYNTYCDYINTEPLADWIHLKSKKQSIPYEKFLDTMVEKTLEVRQKMAELALENILAENLDIHTTIRVAHASKILDPTFQPPIINVNSAWQVDFMKKFCKKYLLEIIQRCNNLGRLEYFINVLNIIQSEV